MKTNNKTVRRGLVCFTLLLSHLVVSASERPLPAQVWSKVSIVRWTIEHQPNAGSPPRPDQQSIVRRLSTEAGARTERLLLKRHLASSVEHVESTKEVTSSIFITGTVTLPISLPPGVDGFRARERAGVFARAKLVLSEKSGRVLAVEQTELKWSDVHWTFGAKRKRNLAVDDVLVKFTRKAVDRVVEQVSLRDFSQHLTH